MSGMRSAWRGSADRHHQIVARTSEVELHREWQRLPLPNDLAGEGRPGRTRKLDVEILPEHAFIARHQHRTEITRSRLQQLPTATRLFFDQHLGALAKL